MGPLAKLGVFPDWYGMQLAVLTGFFFGLALQRAGFADPRKLVNIFYLRDFAVLRVMFTAIVTCSLGLGVLWSLGLYQMELMYILPTKPAAQIIGGLLLGVGFIVGGYCPTTSVVAAVTGRLDGLVFILGMCLGVVGFYLPFDLWRGLYESSQGTILLPQVLGVGRGLTLLFISAMAVGMFLLAGWVEAKINKEDLFTRSTAVTAGALILISVALVLVLVNPDGRTVSRYDAQLTELKDKLDTAKASGVAMSGVLTPEDLRVVENLETYLSSYEKPKTYRFTEMREAARQIHMAEPVVNYLVESVRHALPMPRASGPAPVAPAPQAVKAPPKPKGFVIMDDEGC